MKSKTQGLVPAKRSMALKAKKEGGQLTGNQWQNTPQQTKFMEYWLTPTSPTFGNAYKSALNAGYNDRYAMQIAAPSVNNKWIADYTKRLNLTDEHIRQGIQALALNAGNAKSPDDTRLKAFEILAKISGQIDNKGKGNTTNILVQPILNGASTTPLKSSLKTDKTDETPTEGTYVVNQD